MFLNTWNIQMLVSLYGWKHVWFFRFPQPTEYVISRATCFLRSKFTSHVSHSASYLSYLFLRYTTVYLLTNFYNCKNNTVYDWAWTGHFHTPTKQNIVWRSCHQEWMRWTSGIDPYVIFEDSKFLCPMPYFFVKTLKFLKYRSVGSFSSKLMIFNWQFWRFLWSVHVHFEKLFKS